MNLKKPGCGNENGNLYKFIAQRFRNKKDVNSGYFVSCYKYRRLLHFTLMIRLFQLRDLPLVHRLGERGVALEAEAALIDSPHPVRSALVNRLVGRQYYTYIWKSDNKDGSAFVQVRCEEDCSTARLIYLGASGTAEDEEDQNSIDEGIWLTLLDDLIVATGSRGAHNLIAEVHETGPELPVIRQAGFAVYTRQDIWISDGYRETGNQAELRDIRELDDWDVFVLSSNIVPRLIQSVEPNPPIHTGNNWVLREGNELSALVHINDGPVASWMRLFIHPNAQTKPKRIIQAALAAGQPSEEHPIYCCVRRYQSWLQEPLQEAGFRYWGSQAVMVKHMTKAVKQHAPVKQIGLEPQAVAGSSTLVQGFSQPNGKNHKSRNFDN